MHDVTLFEMEPDPEYAKALEEQARLGALSPDRRRTARQHADVARGVHPLMGSPTRPELGTCGDCALRVLVRYHDKTYAKCEVGPKSNSAATDVRAWWPACGRHEPVTSV